MYYKRALCSLVIPLILIGLLVAACGNTNPSTSTATTPTTAPTPTATTAASSGPVVKTATATVAGKTETILTDAQGKTLSHALLAIEVRAPRALVAAAAAGDRTDGQVVRAKGRATQTSRRAARKSTR